jgi:putative glutamine amidotransferase
MAAAPRVAVARWQDVPLERLHHYCQRLRDAGLEPHDVSGPGQSLGGCVGLLLTGGVDIDPRLYGQEPGPQTQEWNRDRDEFELGLLHEALGVDMPVLAICRGHQLLNVCLGGGLLQHIDSEEHRTLNDEWHSSRWHDVTISRGSELATIYGFEKVHVNSRHHQAVTPEALGNGLRVTAVSDDGLIEGVESESHTWVVGVQWHPERDEEQTPRFAESSRKLLAKYAEAVGFAPTGRAGPTVR